MQELLLYINTLLSEGILIAFVASFIWGIFSVILSPCHLASIPLVIGYISSQKAEIDNKTAFFTSFIFSVGILISIALVGFITISLGKLFGDVGILSNIVVAAVFLVFGLYLLNVIKMSFLNKIDLKSRFKNSSALILGIVFGVSLGPCTFAYIAPILGFTFKISGVDILRSVILLSSFAIGHCIAIAFAGVSGNLITKYLANKKTNRGLLIFQKLLGIAFIIIGIYFIITI